MPQVPEFCDSTRILNWLISFYIFHSCTILVYSIGHTGFPLHLARLQHCNLGEFGLHTQVQTGSRGFDFPCCSILERNFPNFGMEILALRSAKRFVAVYIFPNFVLVQYVVVQKLVKAYPRRLNTFCLFLSFAGGM